MGWNNDDRLLIRAIREGWAVPAQKLPAVIDRVTSIASGGGEATARDSTAAMKALVAAAKLQLETIRIEMQVAEHEALKLRLEALERTESERNPRDTTGPTRTDPPSDTPGDGSGVDGAGGPGAA